MITRVSCELFQTLLSTHSQESKSKSNGMAWLYMNKDGSLVYNIEMHNLNPAENPLITLTNDNGGKKNTELEDLTSSLQKNHAQGVVDRLGPRVLKPLYSGDLGINVATKTETSLIRGRFSVRPVTDARDALEPVLLKRFGEHAPLQSVGMAWIAVDSDCNLHYDISVAGIPSQFYPGDDANEQLKDTKCYHSNRFYDEGKQWYSSSETCTVCACNNRRFKCEPIKCPPVKCKKDEQMVKKGDNCCPSCEGELS